MPPMKKAKSSKKSPDGFMAMFDKLQIENLSAAGAEMLKSMSDAIRSALEKGLLLEQLIIEQQNSALQRSISETQVSKKKKKKKTVCSDHSVLSQSSSHSGIESPNVSQDQPNSSNNSATHVFDDKLISPDDVSQNRLVKPVDDDTKPIAQNEVKLVDPSLLIKPDLLSNTILTINKDMANNFHVSPAANSVSQSCGNETAKNTDNHNSLLNESTSDSVETSNPKLTDESPQDFHNKLTLNINIPEMDNQMQSFCSHEFSSIPHRVQSSKDEYEEPHMPSPIIIKSEFMDLQHGLLTAPLPFIPLSHEEDTPKQESSEPDLKTANDKTDDFDTHKPDNNYEVFIEAGKGATEEEVIDAFQGLDVTYIKIVNRPMYSFGFVSFATDDQMKKALALSKQLPICGQLMSIRPCHEKRKKPSYLKTSSQPQQKRPSQSSFSEHDRKRMCEALPEKPAKGRNSGSSHYSPGNVSDPDSTFPFRECSFNGRNSDPTRGREHAFDRTPDDRLRYNSSDAVHEQRDQRPPCENCMHTDDNGYQRNVRPSGKRYFHMPPSRQNHRGINNRNTPSRSNYENRCKNMNYQNRINKIKMGKNKRGKM